MRVTTVAHTRIVAVPQSLQGEFFHRDDWIDDSSSDIDLLAELTGRGCYKSWNMPNSKTATNEGYLGNILDQKHYSVLEHGTVTFYVEDVSRALLLELERHRFSSYSVESQRFVNTRKHHPDPVIPPAIRDHPDLVESLINHYHESLNHYDRTYGYLRDQGLTVKQAREASRSFLLESTPVDFFVSGNVRAWRDVMGKRWSEHADAEICELAGLILEQLRDIAPNSVSDLPETPYE